MTTISKALKIKDAVMPLLQGIGVLSSNHNGRNFLDVRIDLVADHHHLVNIYLEECMLLHGESHVEREVLIITIEDSGLVYTQASKDPIMKLDPTNRESVATAMVAALAKVLMARKSCLR